MTAARPEAEVIAPYDGLSAQLYDQIAPHDWDEPDYLALAAVVDGEVLELGCGTGRILLPLAQAGHRVVGLDRSEAMLAQLGERLASLPVPVRERVTLVCADAADFDLDRCFSLVLLPYFAFGMIERRAALLNRVAAHLGDDATFAFDFPTVLDSEAPSLTTEVEADHTLGDRRVRGLYRTNVRARDGAILLDSSWEVEGSPRPCMESKIIHTFAPDEVDRMLDAAGLVAIEERATDLPDGSLRRTFVRCRRRKANAYPLWHPHLPRGNPGRDVLTLVAGQGCEVEDVSGRRYLDASGGLWSVQCGLGHPRIVSAVSKQLERLSYGTLFMNRGNDAALALARELVALAPAPLEWVYLTGSGSESVELALKLARLFQTLEGRPDKKGVLYLDASYHGTFFGSMGVTGLTEGKDAFGPLLPGLSPVPVPIPERVPQGTSFEAHAESCARVLETMLDHAGDRVAALVLEPVLGSAGVVVPPRAWVGRVQQACRAHDVLLIADEVATGFGRTGRWFASEHLGLRSDVMLLSKGIDSGYLPLGAVLFSSRIGERLIASGSGIGHGSSHNGNPACCAAALATIEVLRSERLVERSERLGSVFAERLERLKGHPRVGAVRGLGLMRFVGLLDETGAPLDPAGVRAVLRAMQERGVLAYPALSGLIFMPALVIAPEQIEAIAACLEGALDEPGAVA